MSDYLTMAELENKTLKEIYTFAKEFRIPYYSQMNKKELSLAVIRAQAEKQGLWLFASNQLWPQCRRYLYFFFSDSPLQFAKWRQSSGESETAKRVRTLLWFDACRICEWQRSGRSKRTAALPCIDAALSESSFEIGNYPWSSVNTDDRHAGAGWLWSTGIDRCPAESRED